MSGSEQTPICDCKSQTVFENSMSGGEYVERTTYTCYTHQLEAKNCEIARLNAEIKTLERQAKHEQLMKTPLGRAQVEVEKARDELEKATEKLKKAEEKAAEQK